MPTKNFRAFYRGLDDAVEGLYHDELLTLTDDGEASDFDSRIFERAAEWVRERGGFTPSMLQEQPARDVIDETFRILGGAVSSSISEEMPAELTGLLENNAFIFSGLKTFHSLSEVGLSLIGDDGGIKPFEKFHEDVVKIDAKYNRNYLYAEYNHAVTSSQMAAKWHDFQQDGDRYNLQYRTANDERVRAEHQRLHNITLPVSDPFWEQFLPPNGWNCRCVVVQVRKGRYPESDSQQAVGIGEEITEEPKMRIFRFNPGKELKVFPDKHPYFKVPKKTKEVMEQLSEERKREQRITEMIAEMPNTLTAEQKKIIAEHNLILEQEFGITKGKAMSYDEANKGKENPEYSKGGGYRINCQTCTVTHWLRRLGFNVQALPNIVLKRGHQGTAYDKLDKAGVKWTERFINLDGSAADYDYTYKWQRRKGYKAMTPKRLQEYFNEKFSVDGVYEIYCGWKGGDAHVFCAEVSGGKVRYFDPQSGKDDVSSYIQDMKPGLVGIIRIDDKKVNPKIGELFLKVK